MIDFPKTPVIEQFKWSNNSDGPKIRVIDICKWPNNSEHRKFEWSENSDTVVGETLAVFSVPKIWKTGQCLAGQVGKTFLEIFGEHDDF